MMTEWMSEGFVAVTCWPEQFSTGNKGDLLFVRSYGVGGNVVLDFQTQFSRKQNHMQLTIEYN